MRAAGRSLTVAELVAEFGWDSSNHEIIVLHPDDEISTVERAELSAGTVTLEIDGGASQERDLLMRVLELITPLAEPKSKILAATRKMLSDLADEIGEML